MKDKQGEHLDQRIRQALSTLPDAPVKGTSFDAAALWEQLRPELAAQPAPPSRSAQRGWWWLAASLVGALLGGWWWIAQTKQTGNVPTSSVHAAVQQPQRTAPAEAESAAQISVQQIAGQQRANKQRVDKQRIWVANRPVQRTPAPPTDQPMPPPVQDEVSDVPVVAAVPDSPQAATATTYPVAASTVRTLPKRRFAVVHQNELRAEADVRAKLERNDRFVRMGGIPSGTYPTATDTRPGLIIPLN